MVIVFILFLLPFSPI